VLTESGGRIKSLVLKKYRATLKADSPGQELIVTETKADLPLGLSFQSGKGPRLDAVQFAADASEPITLNGERNEAVVRMVHQDPSGLQVEKAYTVHRDSYLIDLAVTVRNQSAVSLEDSLMLDLNSMPLSNKDRYAGFFAYVDGGLMEEKPKDLKEAVDKLNKKPYKLSWASYQDQYFMAVVLPADQERTRIQADQYGKAGVRIQFVAEPVSLGPQAEAVYRYQLFYGPKDYQLLNAMENDLKKSISFGWLDVISKPLLIFMTWLYQYVGNYGLVIILITVIIKALFWPLTAKSYKSMKGMQKLQPKIMKLREKYPDDRQKMNQEMMQLYRAYKVNPLGGCLPMVIQIPVFIALYRLLDYSLELRHAPFWLWINDLAAPDRLFQVSWKIPLMEPPAGIPVLTLLMGASMFLQQKMSPTPGDPIQARMMMLLPIVFTFIFINFPSGLVLYWLVNNILSIGQQTMINRAA
jgi:YidC/Oxa1 family membrane protein insertase